MSIKLYLNCFKEDKDTCTRERRWFITQSLHITVQKQIHRK